MRISNLSFVKHAQLFAQLTRFGIVGLFAATVHFSIVVILVQNGLFVPLSANLVALLISIQVSYWGHRRFTFPETVSRHREAYSKLIFVQLANMAANEGLFYVFLALHLPYQVALLIVLTTLPLVTFTASKFWIFR